MSSSMEEENSIKTSAVLLDKQQTSKQSAAILSGPTANFEAVSSLRLCHLLSTWFFLPFSSSSWPLAAWWAQPRVSPSISGGIAGKPRPYAITPAFSSNTNMGREKNSHSGAIRKLSVIIVKLVKKFARTGLLATGFRLKRTSPLHASRMKRQRVGFSISLWSVENVSWWLWLIIRMAEGV